MRPIDGLLLFLLCLFIPLGIGPFIIVYVLFRSGVISYNPSRIFPQNRV